MAYTIPRPNTLAYHTDEGTTEIDLNTWRISRVPHADAMSDRAFSKLAAVDAEEVVRVLVQQRSDSECGKGWEGIKGNCKRSKGVTRKALESDAVNTSKWAFGKVVGSALATAASQHGITDPPALLLAESGVQALLSTAQKARQKKMGAGAIAKEFISETVALMATKYEPAWDDGVRGGSDEVRMMIDRATSPDAPAQARALYRQSKDRLAALVNGKRLRLDAADEFAAVDAEALLMLSAIALGIVARREKV